MPLRLNGKFARLARSNVLLVLLVLVAGGGAMFAARHYIDGEVRRAEADSGRRYQLVPVVVAGEDIPAGTLVEARSLAVRPMPAGFLPAGHVPQAAAAELIGRRLQVALRRGDVLTHAMVAASGGEGLSMRIPAGSRAVTLPVDEISSHAGMLAAGDAVDLYLSQASEAGATRIGLLLQDVPVLATGTRVGPVPGIAREAGQREMGYGTITVLATVDDAARIILAQQSGALFMALRGRGDGEPVLLGVHDSRELLRGIGPSLRAARRGSAVEVLVGGNGEPAPRRLWLQTGGRS